MCTLHFKLALLFTNISSHSLYVLHIYDSGCNIRGDKETIFNLKSTILVIYSLFVEKKQSSFTGDFHFPKTHNNDLFRIFLLYLFKISLVPNGFPHIWKFAFALPLFKGGDPTEKLSAKLSGLSNILDSPGSEELFLYSDNIPLDYRSRLWKRHSTTKAAIKVIHDFTVSLNNRQQSIVFFIDLFLGTVLYKIMVQVLFSIELSVG